MKHVSAPGISLAGAVPCKGVNNVMTKIIIAVIYAASVFATVFAAEDVNIYKVTATSLVVREGPGVQHRALYSLPRNAYVLNHTGMQDQKIVTVANQKGRWINVSGRFEYTIGYVFEGFLAKEDNIKYYPIEDYCEIAPKTIKCGKNIFQYSETTPLTGAWFSNPETRDGNIQYIYENSSRMLKKIVNNSGSGFFYMLVQDSRIVQFITAPTPRGGD